MSDQPSTREEIERLRKLGRLLVADGGSFMTTPVGSFGGNEFLMISAAAEAHLSEPARIKAARQAGYREGVEAAAQVMDAEAARCRDYGAAIDHEALAQREFAAAATCRMAAARLRALSLPDAPAEPAAQSDADGWIAWGGGDTAPVPLGTLIKVRFRDGEVLSDRVTPAWPWRHSGGPNDIVAYRPAQPAEPSAPVADVDRSARAKALAEVYGITLQDVRSTVGEPRDANNWRQFLGLADDGWTPMTLRVVADLEAKVAAADEDAIQAHAEAERQRTRAADCPIWKERAMEKQRRAIALEAENAALREIAEKLGDLLGEDDDDFPDETPITIQFGRTTHYSLKLGFLRRARALLQEGRGNG